MDFKRSLRKRHAMHEFGTVFGTTQEIRVNPLSQRLDPWVPFPHRHSFYHVVLITSGSGWHEIDFRRYLVSAGKLFFMKPGQVHSWYLDRSCKGYVLEFEESQMSHQFLSNPADYYELQPSAKRKMSIVLQSMLEEFENHSRHFEVSLRHYLVAFLVEVSRLTPNSLQTQIEDGSLNQFFLLLEKNFQQEHEVEFYAKKLSLSSKALTMRCARAFGKSARALIHDRMILEAKRLLAYSAFTVAEVGYELGFDDPNYFTRFFKKNTSATPGSFRSTVRSSHK